MGCDIHLYTETKKIIEGETKWVISDFFMKNPFFGIYSYEEEYERISIYRHRSYRLFSLLANVRNYLNSPFICEPKGFPEDASEFVRSENERWGCDAHSHSYFTLRELIEAREEFKITSFSGFMTKENAKLVDEGKMPHVWFEHEDDPSMVFRSWSFEEDPIYVIVEPIQKHAVDIGLIPNFKKIEEINNDIRIVFWFDN